MALVATANKNAVGKPFTDGVSRLRGRI